MMARLLAGGAASLLLSMAIVAAFFSVANLASAPARIAMTSWEAQQRAGAEEDWKRAFRRLRLARRLNPLSADYSADLGRLLEWRAWQTSPGSRDYTWYRERADTMYVEAVIKRPSWGFGWAHLAENRFLLGGRDESYRFALDKAMVLAPWEPAVQRKAIWMGMASWPSLSESMRSDIRGTVQRALDLSIYTDEIVRLAIQYDWTDELVPMLRTQRAQEIFDFVNKRIQSRQRVR
jgi:hypothetical protein